LTFLNTKGLFHSHKKENYNIGETYLSHQIVKQNSKFFFIHTFEIARFGEGKRVYLPAKARLKTKQKHFATTTTSSVKNRL